MDYIYQYTIASIIISFVTLISFLGRKTLTTNLTKSFTTLIICCFVCGISDLISFYTLPAASTVPLWLNYIINIIYYITIISIPSSFFYVILFLVKIKKVRNKVFNYLVAIPFLVQFVFIVTTPIFKLAFSFDENFVYSHGPCFSFLFITALGYSVAGLVITFIYRKKITTEQFITIFFFVLSTMISLVVQLIITNLIIVEFLAAISTLLMYFSLDNPANYKDKEMGVLNREAFHIVLERMFDKKEKFTVVGIQIIGLKHLSDTIGNENRNEFLWQIANTLTHISQKLTVCRISSTRFVFVFKHDVQLQNHLIDSIKLAFDSPFRIGELKISLTVRMVILECPEDASNDEDCLDLVENSLINLVDADANTCIRANKVILEKKRRESKILQIMKTAIKKQEFYIVYQPIYNLKEKRFTTAEALVRLKSDELGIISPEEFIPIAEKNGLILQIGEFVMENVCSFMAMNRIWEKGIEYVHVNLSVIQCMQEKLSKQLLSIMDAYCLNYKLINLEVTETSAAASADTLINNMTNLIENKINFSLDDYGTGFSNIASLVKYPFRTIKLDKTLVWQAVQDKKALGILKHVINMVKSLNMQVVAEGVETEKQAELLKNLDCDFIQGFYYSMPISEEELLNLLRIEQER